eukprot:jgi/Undpi1/6583/HiC_scaffold_20.g09062.m1
MFWVKKGMFWVKKGMFWVKKGRGHIFRALIESVCMGTELVFEAMRKAGYEPSSVAVAGGATRSRLWLQTHADVSNVPMKVTREREACLLGSAILAAVGAGLFADIPSAVDSMVHVEGTVATVETPLSSPTGGEGASDGGDFAVEEIGNEGVVGLVNASILAADMADLSGEVERVVEAGADWIHVDVVDNHFAKVLTFGPPVVASLRRRHPSVFLDVHLAVNNPGEYVDALKDAGASQVLFHPEAVPDGGKEASRLATRIIAAGMRAGVALRPETPVSVVLPLLWPRQLLHCVDVLAVNPGFGGQTFDSSVLAKVTELRSVCPGLDIQVDGGVNASTAAACVAAGANILTSGSFIFGCSADFSAENTVAGGRGCGQTAAAATAAVAMAAASGAIAELRRPLVSRWSSKAASES